MDAGYDNATGEWDEYSPYVNAEGMELGSPVRMSLVICEDFIPMILPVDLTF